MTPETIAALLVGVLSSSVIVALVEWRRFRRLQSADTADKLSSAWDRYSEELRTYYEKRVEALTEREAGLQTRVADLEMRLSSHDRLYEELGQRLQGEIKLRLQHEATIDKLKMENETLRQRVTELEREIGELRDKSIPS